MTTPTLDPLANEALIDQNTGTKVVNPATSMADRVDLLNSTGHSWMPSDMQTTLAASPTSNSQLVTIADSIKSTLSKTWDGFSEAFDDPVLHKQPTTGLALARMLNASVGPIPVAGSDLAGIQKSLQAEGFGKGLQANGVWGADWNDAYDQYSYDRTGQQYAGDRPGSTTAVHAAHGFLSALMPDSVANSLIGFAKSLPGDVRDLAANIVGSAVNTVADPSSYSLHDSKAEQAASPGAHAATEIERLLGNSQAQQRVTQEIQHPAASTLQDVGTVLAIYPVAGEGSAAARAARVEFSRGVTLDAAQRGPGVIAKTFGGRTAEQITADNLTGTVTRGGLRAFTNIPLLRQISPVVGKLTDADGLYYQGRTLLARPYQYPIVRIAGREFQNATIGGAVLRGTANLENAVGLGNPESRDVTNERVFDTVDANLQRIDGTPFGHHFSIGINDLALLLHGPLTGGDAISSRVGSHVQGLVDTMSDASGRLGIHGAFELATGKDLDELRKTFGSDEELDRFLASKVADLSASHYVQRGLNNAGTEFGDPTYRDQAAQLADEVWSDPAAHSQAVKELIADPYELKARIQADMLDSQMKSDTGLSDAKSFMRAGGLLADQVIRPGLAVHLFGGDGQTLIRNAQDEFDFGLGTTNPMRRLGMTRRDYTAQVNRLGDSVSRQVTAATRSLNDDVNRAQQAAEAASARLQTVDRHDPEATAAARSEARSAHGKLQAAKGRQRRFLTSVNDGTVSRVAKTIDGSGSGRTSFLESQWAALAADHDKLRNLVRQAQGGEFNTMDFINNRPDSNVLYDQINGPARPVPADVGTGEWLRQHLTNDPGSLGLGRLETKSTQQAARDIATFQRALDAAKTPERLTQVTEQIKDYLHAQFGVDARTLSLWNDDPQALLERASERAKDLASDVFVTPDAPQAVRDTIEQMAALGYKPMLGSHIGHLWDDSLPPMEDIKGALTRRRKVINGLGLNPDQITSRTAGTDARIRMMSELQRTIDDDPHMHIPARATAATVMAVANEVLEPELPWASNLAFNAARVLHRPAVTALMEQRGIDRAEALTQYKAEIARALQLRDVPRKQWMRVMTTPAEGTTAAGSKWTWDGMDEKSAALLYRAVLRGYAKRGASMMGWQAIEDWGRAGFGFLDNIATRHPGQDWLQSIADIPNRYVQLRNRLRFDLSPFFDLRRVSKTNFKMNLEGVPATFNPLGRMVDDGTFDAAHATLRRIVGDTNTAAYDDADRYLHQQSVWGIYNSRHLEAYFARTLEGEGKSDDEIREALNRVFSYGSSTTGGRSALERTINTVFFPFSFEKTLLRNTGAYLLDHPGQSLILSAAINEYQKANQHEVITNWVNDHLPILQEFQKLNGFADGISPGEFGGINAPLLNLFLPQTWSRQNYTKQNLSRFVPIVSDFGQLWRNTIEQAEIAKNAGYNAADYAISLGEPRDALDPYRPTITPQAQVRKATEMRSQIIISLNPALTFNAHQADDSTKIRWPVNAQLPESVQGQVIDRTTIGYLVKRWYPAYDPSSAQQYAEQQAKDVDLFLANERATDPQRAQQYQVFVNLANQLQTKMINNDFDTEQAALITSQFRQIAIAASENDPAFYNFYRDHYQYTLGPLEQLTA